MMKEQIFYKDYISNADVDAKKDANVQAIFQALTTHKKVYLKASAGGGKTTANQKLGQYLWNEYRMRCIIIYPNTSILNDKEKNDFGFTTVRGLSNTTKHTLENSPLVQTTPDAFINADIKDDCFIAIDESTTMLDYANFKDVVMIPMYMAVESIIERGGYALSMDATDMVNEAYGYSTLEAIKTTDGTSLGDLAEYIQDVHIIQTKKKSKTILNDICHKIKTQKEDVFTQVHINDKDLIKEVPNFLGDLAERFAYIFSSNDSDQLVEIEMNSHYLPTQEDLQCDYKEYIEKCKSILKSIMAGNLPEDCLGVFHTKKFEIGVNLSTKKDVELHIISSVDMPTVTSVKQTANRRRKMANESFIPVNTFVYGIYGNNLDNYNKVAKLIKGIRKTDTSELATEIFLSVGSRYVQSSQSWNKTDYCNKLKSYYMNPIEADYCINSQSYTYKASGKDVINWLISMPKEWSKLKHSLESRGYDTEAELPKQANIILKKSQRAKAIDLVNLIIELYEFNIGLERVTKSDGDLEVDVAKKLIEVSKALQGVLQINQEADNRQWKKAVKLINESVEVGSISKSKLNELDNKIKSKVRRYFERIYFVKNSAWHKHKHSLNVKIKEEAYKPLKTLKKQRETTKDKLEISTSKDVLSSVEYQYTIFNNKGLQCAENELKKQALTPCRPQQTKIERKSTLNFNNKYLITE